MLNIEKLKSLLEAQKLTQEQLAARVGISPTMTCFILKGFKNPSLEVAKRIADTLGVKLDDILKEG